MNIFGQIGNAFFVVKFINVKALMRYDGRVIPLEIEWEDGKTFAIDKVLDIRKVASTKGGGKGVRYTCKILGKEKFLFLDEYYWWVEV